MKVRELLPLRRTVPTKSPKEGRWTEHKNDLQEDFHCHCGYCGSYDGYKHTWYEVDHFIPKSLFNGRLSNVEYSNLVYSCKFCNNKKLAKWPTGNIELPNYNNQGFVDPCDKDYDNHLYRTSNGSIRWLTPLGKWMVEVGFKFDERDYAVKLLWELNQLRKAIDYLILEAKKYSEDSEGHKGIITKSQEYALKYFLFRNELDEYYKTM